MKIGILTQPLNTNYGGLLQNYALQTVLKQMGHKVWTVDRPISEIPIFIKFLSITNRLLLRILYLKPTLIRIWPTDKEHNIIAHNTNRFIKENISTTKKIGSLKRYAPLKYYNFSAYIVGSDQVWRPKYLPCITNYFLDFIDIKDRLKRIAYAASFGVDNWEFSPKQTTQCASLAKKFDAISVREDSAVRLCKEYLEVDAIHVLDPTMLLKREDYIKLVEKDNIPKSEGTLLTYVLDKSAENAEIIKRLAKIIDLTPFSVMPEKTFSEVGKRYIEDCIFPPVTEWIRGFMDADYVVTDSFHGTVFSIIFNKPFISIGNTGRGLTRFTSLLKMFGLEKRLILSSDELTLEIITDIIDFDRINQIWDNEQQRAYKFLDKALNS
jgi:polysaccharide pyruvyl transferase WcaK-like protein